MIIRAYRPEDMNAMIRIWNEVVEEGIAFPQEDCLDIESGAAFFASQSYTGVAEVDASIVGLYILPSRAMLQIKLTAAVEDMEVYDRMEYLTTIMCVSPRHLPEDIPVLVDDGEQFIWIVSHCLYVYFRCFFIQTMCPYSVCSLVQ